MISEDYLSIDESSQEYAIDKLIPESEQALALWWKHFRKYVSRAKFWKPRLTVAKQCAQFEGRNILTPSQRQKYLDEDKWPIEPQEMRPIIASLERMIERAVPGTDVTYEDETPPENAASPDTVKTVISWLKHKLKIKEIRNKTLHKGLVVGYPQCVWADKIRGVSVVPGVIPLRISLRPWDSVLPEEYYSSETGDDINDVVFIRPATKQELYDTYPSRVAVHKKHSDMFQNDEGFQSRFQTPNSTDTSTDRSDLIFNMVADAKFDSIYGKYFVIESVFPITSKRTVWVNEATYDVIILPPDWDDARKEEWLSMNLEYTVEHEIEVKTLWVTTISSDGFIWENREHWYQEDGRLPCAWYIADTVDNQPMGLGEDLLPYILLKTACKIEGLSQVRKGTGRLTAIQAGAVKNSQHINKELSKEEGVLIINKGHTVDDAVKSFERRPNTTFLDYEDRIGGEMQKVHRVNEGAMGGTINRQSESAKRLQAELSLTPQSRYVDNYYSFSIQLENLLCRMIPLTLTEEMIISIKDEWGQSTPPVTVNKKEYSAELTEAKIIANDIVSTRYRVEAVTGDDSMASRENQMRDFMELLTAIGNQLFKLDPMFLGQTFSMFPNRFAKDAAKFLMEYGKRQQDSQQMQAKAESDNDRAKQENRKFVELEKIRRPKIAFKFTPADIKQFPEGANLMYQWLKQNEQEQAELEGPGEQAGPEMQSGPEGGRGSPEGEPDSPEGQMQQEVPEEEMAAA